ncbi:hypothetical protein DUI87_10990 [Hirundo rustica rustica]|uniref:Sam68 tyrosine-rich domain-containing protein n=1 Tax=Hirundo rustica rustica TaxID=333673 RepID=A0A3M0KJM5_HIRRU|nr:hypothetical protein DUI87_10990 [Hirundo rustica rustica]
MNQQWALTAKNASGILDCIRGYDDGYGGEYDDPSYEAYDNSYATQTQSVPEYYDYGHGTSEEAYDSYDVSSFVASLLALLSSEEISSEDMN